MTSLEDRKKELRKQVGAAREGIPAQEHGRASREAAFNALRHLPLSPESKASVFWPLGAEIDTRPLLAALAALGVVTGLPRMVGKQRPLTFRRWSAGEPLERGGFGVMQPSLDAPEVIPEVMLVPLLAFDRRGLRLGYGGGFYDRTIAELTARGASPFKAGYAFACQEVDEVPAGERDQPLDCVITEAGIISCSA